MWPKLNVKAQDDLKIYFGKKFQFVLGLLVGDIFIQLYAPNPPLTQALNPLRKREKCDVMLPW